MSRTKAFAAQIEVALLCFGLHAANTWVSVPTGYSEGEVRVGVTREGDDTVSFSTGISLTALRWSAPDGPLAVYWSLWFLDGTWDELEYHWSESMGITDACACSCVVGSADTTWVTAESYPDSTVSMDRCDISGESSLTEVRWLTLCYPDLPVHLGPGVPFPYSTMSGWNSVVYARWQRTRHMKFQVAGWHIEPKTGGHIDTLFVRWAADSSGDGLFHHSLGVRPGMTRKPTTCTRRLLHSAWPLLDLRGRRVVNGDMAYPRGVHIRQTPTGGTTMQCTS